MNPFLPRTKDAVRKWEVETIVLAMQTNPGPWLKNFEPYQLVAALYPKLSKWQRFCLWVGGIKKTGVTQIAMKSL